MDAQKRAFLFGISAVLLWSTVASAFKISLRYLDPPQLVLYASLASLLALGGVLVAQGKTGLVLSCTRRDCLLSLGLGLLNPFLYYLVLFEAYDLLPAQEAQPLNYTWAIALGLLSIPLLGQRLTRADILATAVSYTGVVIISTRGDLLQLRFSDPLGVGLALGSTVVWALYWIFNTRDPRDPVAGLFLNFLFGLPFVLAYVLVFSETVVPDPRGLLGAAYVGVFEMGITFVLWLSALKLTTSASRIGNLIFVSPFLSLVLIHFLVGEDIRGSTFAGLVFIMGGLAVQQAGHRKA
ncbi:MAG: DMT family transporter [Deltaproteobacteria bacterium]|nr:DMT family transporter [Deltaproteobacteria bacterium]